MGIKGQCAVLAVFALLSIGLTGCMQTMDNYMPLQQPVTSGCPNCQGPNAIAAAGSVPRQRRTGQQRPGPRRRRRRPDRLSPAGRSRRSATGRQPADGR